MQETILLQISNSELEALIESQFIKALEKFQSVEHKSEDKFLSPEEALRYLRLKKPTLYGLTSNQKIPFFKKGKLLYFSQAELKAWIESGRKETISEIEAETDTYLKKKGTKLL